MSAYMAPGDPTVIRMDGVFDASAAQRLAQEIASAGDAEIRIDMSHVREFDDFGVALLARELAGRDHTSVSGLLQHHRRLLRYLGIDAGPAEHGSEMETA